MKLVENQTLWFVGHGNYARTRGVVTVVSVGRKWAEVKGVHRCRIALDTLVADAGGFSSPGRCYLSKEAWVAQEGPVLAWRALRNQMAPICPPNLSYEDIVAAGKLLGLDVAVAVDKAS